uniref:CCAAT-binding factor domain-containing protein n=1 Tax=Theileria annulata TaxID=5874 RepID=A0A3B0N363_THEAN
MKSSSQEGRSISEDRVKQILEIYGTKGWDKLSAEISKNGLKVPGNPPKLPVYDICRLGRELMESLSRKYVTIACKNDSEERWLHISAQDPFIYKEGKKSSTFSDKIDSMVVLIHNNCVFNWKMFSELMNLVKSEKLRVKSSCIDLIYSAFMEVLPSRKLRYVNEVNKEVIDFLGYKLHPFSKNLNSWDTLDLDVVSLLLTITFEDYLKGIYSTFIQELSDVMNRGVDFLQKKASNLALQMLIQKPEQEEILLDLIISRLTHKDNKMSSYVFKMLDTLLLNHEKMKGVVVKGILTKVKSLLPKLQSELIKGTPGIKESGRRRKRRKLTINNECILILKSIYRCILYFSKLHYTKSDHAIVNVILKDAIDILLLFIRQNSTNDNRNNVNDASKTVKAPNVLLCKYEECDRIIKILLLFINKLLNYYKNTDDYDKKKSLFNSGIIENLYELSYKTKSRSITISVLVLMYHICPNSDEYYKLLYNNAFNIRLYESTSVHKFLALIQQILEGKNEKNSILIRKLLQVTLCNCNNNINSEIINTVLNTTNNDNFWELRLQKLSYNPFIISALERKYNKDDENYNLYNELSVFSSALQLDYTLEKYWRNRQSCKLYQKPFQLYYQSKFNLQNIKEDSHSSDDISVTDDLTELDEDESSDDLSDEDITEENDTDTHDFTDTDDDLTDEVDDDE